MYSRKSVGPKMEPSKTPPLNIIVETSQLRNWKAKYGLTSDLKFDKTLEDQHAKPCRKLWIYQVLLLE